MKLRLTKSGDAYDGAGNKHDPKRLEKAFKEITEIRNNWRSEWLNHSYSQKEIEMFVTYHKFVNGKLKKVTELLDPDTLMEKRTPGISLEDWIENPTSQGLPRKSVKEGRLCYWQPTKGCVSGFDSFLGGYVLDCNWNFLVSYSELGVAVVREKKGVFN